MSWSKTFSIPNVQNRARKPCPIQTAIRLTGPPVFCCKSSPSHTDATVTPMLLTNLNATVSQQKKPEKENLPTRTSCPITLTQKISSCHLIPTYHPIPSLARQTDAQQMTPHQSTSAQDQTALSRANAREVGGWAAQSTCTRF